MKKKILAILILICIQYYAFSQEKDLINTKNNTIFLELGGKSLWYSVNYDRCFLLTDKFKMSLSLGYSFFATKYQTITPQIAFLHGKKKWNTELGFAYTYILKDDNVRVQPFYSFSLGMRYQPKKGGLFFRGAVTPLIGLDLPIAILPWLGLALGYTF